MECPNCNNEILGNSIYCNFCGTKIETCDSNGLLEVQSSDNISITKKRINKKKVGICCSIIFILAIIIWGWQSSLIYNVENLYNQGEYEKADSEMGKVLFRSSLGTYVDKIEIMGRIDGYFNNAKKYINNDKMNTIAVSYYVDTIEACIGYNDRAETAGYLDELLSIRKEATQMLANEGYKVMDVLNNLKVNDKYAYYPICIENPDHIDDLILDTYSSYSQKEVIATQNEKNPIQIASKDIRKDGEYYYCTGTISNLSDDFHSYVEVRVTYYDNNEVVLTTDWGYGIGSEGIKAGENQQFEIMTKVNGDVSKYKVEIQDYE